MIKRRTSYYDNYTRAWGDAIIFLETHHNMDFKQAVHYLPSLHLAPADGSYKIVWRCTSRLESTGLCGQSPIIEETVLHDALLRAINQVLEQRELIEADVEHTLAMAIAKQEGADDTAMLEIRLAKLDEDFRRANPHTTEDAEKQNQEFIRITTEQEGIHEKLRVIRQEQEVMAHGNARVKALYDLIDEKASGIREYYSMSCTYLGSLYVRLFRCPNNGYLMYIVCSN